MIIRWLVCLSGGESIVGRPSMLSREPHLQLPATNESDWLRLQRRCRDSDERITAMTLWTPHGPISAPDGRGGYGYSEGIELSQRTNESRLLAVSLWWWEGDHAEIRRYRLSPPMLEGFVVRKWQPCMIPTDRPEGEFAAKTTLMMSGNGTS